MKYLLGVLIACVLLLAGCTSRLVYPYMDWLIAWKMDSYLGLDVDQERWLSNQLEHMLIWHRSQELSSYTTNIHFMLKDITTEKKLTEKQAREHLDNMDESVVRITSQLIPMAAGLTVRLRANQLAPFLSKRQTDLERKIQDWQAVTDNQRKSDMHTKLRKRLAVWIGEVNPEQDKLVHQWVTWRIESFPLWLEFQKEVLHALEANHKLKKGVVTQKDIEKKLNTVLFTKNSNFDRYRTSFKSFFVSWLAQLDETLTSKQRERLIRRLAGFKSELQLLAAH